MPKISLLIVEDEEKMQDILRTTFSGEEYEVLVAATPQEAKKIFDTQQCDVIITDIRLKKYSGMEVIKEVKNRSLQAPIIVTTAYGTVEQAVTAMKDGVFDYILKPFNLEELKLSVKRAWENKKLTLEVERLRKELQQKYDFNNIVGKSKIMQNVFETILQIAKSDATVLICGESGSGKELVAKAIHYNSNRKNEPLFILNCSALPENLLESELFGYEKGAFTDAKTSKPGYLSLSDNGTLVLDEIGDMQLNLQAKILRVIQEQEFIPLGGTKSIKTNVRFIACTNQNLKQKISENLFREDLYYRLNVVTINIPSLRERKEDIPILFDCFLNEFNEKYHKNISYDDSFINTLINYDFPGNVRELKNLTERLVLLSKKEILSEDSLPVEIINNKIKGILIDVSVPFKKLKENLINDFEKKYFLKLLKENNWNISRSALQAGIERKHLQRKIKELDIASEKKI